MRTGTEAEHERRKTCDKRKVERNTELKPHIDCLRVMECFHNLSNVHVPINTASSKAPLRESHIRKTFVSFLPVMEFYAEDSNE